MERQPTQDYQGSVDSSSVSEIQKDNPFVIRGHHLNRIMDLFHMSAPSAANQLVSSLSKSKDPYLSASYVYDVIGRTDEEHEQYEKQVSSVFSEFVNLTRTAPDHPVKLVVGQKDGICKSCIGGDHCTLANDYYGNAQFDMERDTSFLDTFEIIASSLGDEVGIQEETVTYGDNREYKVKSLTTTVGSVVDALVVVLNMSALNLDIASDMLKGSLPDGTPPTKENLIAVCKAKIANMQSEKTEE